jgi:hypothetical protein
MKTRLLLLTLIFCTAALFAHARTPGAGAEEDTKKYDVAGGVWLTNTKKPISNVNVTAYSESKKEKVVVTDDNGNYSFNDLKPGLYKLVFEKHGYKKVVKDKVMIRMEVGCQLDVEMSEDGGEFQIIPGQLIFTDYF